MKDIAAEIRTSDGFGHVEILSESVWTDRPMLPYLGVMADTDTKELIAQLDIEYQAAVERNDAEAMGRILADDFVLITGVGRVRTRDDLLQEARERVAIYEYQEAGERTVRVWGETAVVTALLRAKGEQGEEQFEVSLWYSDTYAMIDGEWRYVLGQASTRLPDAG
jgi:ketosteroid isomerase-like protein